MTEAPLGTGALASAQYAKFPKGFFKRSLSAGLDPRSLGTLARLGIFTSGNPEGWRVSNRKIAFYVNRSRRTVQRDVRAFEKHVRGFQVERERPGGRRRRSWPNLFKLPQVGREDPGTILFADMTRLPAWEIASRAQQAVLLVLLELLGPAGRELSHREIGDGAHLSRSCVRQAIYYWRGAGVLEVEARESEDEGYLPSFLRVRVPREITHAGVSEKDAQRARLLMPVVRWIGLALAALAVDEPAEAWWSVLGRAIEDGSADERERVETHMHAYLSTEARMLGYHGASRIEDIRSALPIVWHRREAFDAETAELRADGRGQRDPARRLHGEPYEGDWVPPQPDAPAACEAHEHFAAAEDWSRVFDNVEAARPELAHEHAYVRARVRPGGVREGAFVIIAQDATVADAFSEQYVSAIVDAVGCVVSVRLEAYQRELDKAAARRRVTSAGVEPVRLALERHAWITSAAAELPELALVRMSETQERRAAHSLRFTARLELASSLASARECLEHVEQALAWRRPGASASRDARPLLRPPDWLDVEERATRGLADLARAEALYVHVQGLGPLPAGVAGAT